MATDTFANHPIVQIVKKQTTLHQRYKLKSEQVHYNEVLSNNMVEDYGKERIAVSSR